MLRHQYEISLHRLLPLVVMVLIYIHWFVKWQVVYWFNEEFILTYITLLSAAEIVSVKGSLSLDFRGAWFDAFIYLSPLLLCFKGLGARFAFYGSFLVIYFFPIAPYQSVVVLGLLDSSIYTLVIGAVGILLGSDIHRWARDPNRIQATLNSRGSTLVVFVFALMVVFISTFVKQGEIASVLETARMLSDPPMDPVQIQMPFLQAAVFILLAAGVFINSSARAAFIILSWIILAWPWAFRLEWAEYHLIVDLYTLLSGVLLWFVVSPKRKV